MLGIYCRGVILNVRAFVLCDASILFLRALIALGRRALRLATLCCEHYTQTRNHRHIADGQTRKFSGIHWALLAFAQVMHPRLSGWTFERIFLPSNYVAFASLILCSEAAIVLIGNDFRGWNCFQLGQGWTRHISTRKTVSKIHLVLQGY